MENTRHPVVCLVEAVDDIYYEIKNVEDANKLKIISNKETAGLLLVFFDEMTRKNIQKYIIDEGLTDGNE